MAVTTVMASPELPLTLVLPPHTPTDLPKVLASKRCLATSHTYRSPQGLATSHTYRSP